MDLKKLLIQEGIYLTDKAIQKYNLEMENLNCFEKIKNSILNVFFLKKILYYFKKI